MAKTDKTKTVQENILAADISNLSEKGGPNAGMDTSLLAALEANEKLNADLEKIEAENDEARETVQDLQKELAHQALLHKNTGAERDSLKLDLEASEKLVLSLQKKLEKAGAGIPEKDCVVLDGKVFDVVSRHTAKWLNDHVLKRFVAEDATVVVLNRVGE